MKQISNSHLRWPKGRRSCVKYISKERINNESIYNGMTYKEDVAAVKESFSKMLENGTYKGDLFSDL